MNITILGCGNFALALANVAKDNCNITMWSKLDNEVLELKDKYKEYKFTNNLEEAIKNKNLIIIAIPIEYLENTIIDLVPFYNNEPLLIASKGITQESNLFASDIINKYLKTNNIGAISGATFAIDMLYKFPMIVTLASTNESLINITKQALKTDYLNIEVSSDLIGVELCGAIKNIIAILEGILDGINYPESTKALLLMKSIYEINNILIGINSNPKTLLTSAGIGDLVMTSSSTKSRNYTLGTLIGQNKDKNIIDEYIKNNTIEGLYTTKSIYNLLKNNNINSKLINISYDILYNNKSITLLIYYLKTELN